MAFSRLFLSSNHIKCALISRNEAVGKQNFHVTLNFIVSGVSLFYPNSPNQLTLKTRLERVIENDLFHIFLYNKIRNSGPLNFQSYDIKLVLYHYPAHRMCSAISIAQINVYSTESESTVSGSQILLVQSFYLNSQMLQSSD